MSSGRGTAQLPKLCAGASLCVLSVHQSFRTEIFRLTNYRIFSKNRKSSGVHEIEDFKKEVDKRSTKHWATTGNASGLPSPRARRKSRVTASRAAVGQHTRSHLVYGLGRRHGKAAGIAEGRRKKTRRQGLRCHCFNKKQKVSLLHRCLLLNTIPATLKARANATLQEKALVSKKL